MKKKAIILSVTIIIFILLTGCFNQDDSDISEATEVALKYKKEELEATYFENNTEITLDQIIKKEELIKPLTTQSFFEKKSGARVFIRSSTIALKTKSDLLLEEISFEKKSASENSIVLAYKGILVIGKERKNLEGAITLIKEDDFWKVNFDRYNHNILIDIIDSYRQS